MKHLFSSSILPFLTVLSLLGFFPSISHAAFNPPEVFEKKCSSCHTVGGGDDIGPDLKGVNERRSQEWLLKMITSSQDLIGSGDPIAVGLFNKYKKKKMPDTELSKDEIVELLEFIKTGGPAEQAMDAKPATDATAAEIVLGKKIFLGTHPLSNGGPACLACHAVGNVGPLGGGTLGPDLTQAYSRYEDKGLSRALQKMGFPVMQEIYYKKPLTEAEAYALKAFLYEEDKKGPEAGDYEKKFLFLGLGGAVIFLGIIDLSWRKRRKKSTKPTHGGVA